MKLAKATGAAAALCAAVAMCLHTNAASAQGSGTLRVDFMTQSLDSLIIHSERSNYNQTQLDGFRIQIYSGSGIKSKDEATAAQSRFMRLFPEQKVYVIYNAPFWRVRVGDYRSRSEAMTLLNTVKQSFGGSYIVRDNTVRKKNFRQ